MNKRIKKKKEKQRNREKQFVDSFLATFDECFKKYLNIIARPFDYNGIVDKIYEKWNIKKEDSQ